MTERRIGLYTIAGEIGRGAMGVVLRGVSPSGEEVAVKIIQSAKPASEPRARFDRERRLLAELGEGFVPLLDSGETPQGPYIVMPFLAGGTLRDRLRKRLMPIDEALRVGRSLARSMGRAHKAGIVHRDLKPENVLFDESGRPYIADLGLAKHADSSMAKSLSLSIAGEARGTYGYMPPEQMQDAKSVDARSDVFSLGAILYECLTGKAAFQGENLVAVLAAVSDGVVTPVVELRPDAPPWLAAVVHRALERAPDRRPRDGHALADALESSPKATRAPWALLVAAVLVAVGSFVGWPVTRRAPLAAPPPLPAVPSQPTPPRRAVWRSRAPLPVARMKLSAATGPDGAIHVLGGRGPEGTSNRHDVYDPREDRWSTKEPLPAPRALAGAAFVGNKLYVVGGADEANKRRDEVFEWNPNSDSWRSRASLPEAGPSPVVVGHGERLWAIAGAATAYVYDPQIDHWSKGPAIPGSIAGVVAIPVGERIVVVGEDHALVWARGEDAFRALRYDRPELALAATAGGFVGGRVFIASGRRREEMVPAVVSFDPARLEEAVALEEAPPLAVPRRSHAAACSFGKLYVFGGLVESEKRALASVEELSP